jgi:hypothetical protein
MVLREITPFHLRCGLGQCPAVFEDGPDDLVIIGTVETGDVADNLAGRVGTDECAIRISRAMFAELAANRPTSQAAKRRGHRQRRQKPR